MAKRSGRRATYRKTPARAAALRKAQLISAQKRRGRRAKIKRAAIIVGGIAGTAVVYGAQAHLNKYASNPREAIRDYRDVKGFIQRHRGNQDPNAPHMPTRIPVHPNARRSVARGFHGSRSMRRSVAGRRIRSR